MMYSVNEYIARYLGDTLYPKEIGLYYRKKNLYLDTTSTILTKNLALSYDMRKEGAEIKDIFNALVKFPLSVGTWVYCDHEGYGVGRVERMFESGNMFVKFKERKLPTMCDAKTTIHDEKKRKIKLIA